MKEGGTVRDALMTVWRQTGQAPEELQLPPMPEEVSFALTVFRDLQRDYANGVPLPVSNQEIAAWCWLNRIRLRPDELQLLRVLDSVWRRVLMEATPRD